mmetsp:Transcript_47636/g.82782  ORF Transcript_47636/g.82782 Transcript_47636/m.82782 type:complete len:103 (-) Transcript_47636:49-357(-)
MEGNGRPDDSDLTMAETESYSLDKSAANGRHTIVATSATPTAFSMHEGDEEEDSDEAEAAPDAAESTAVRDTATGNTTGEANPLSRARPPLPSWGDSIYNEF